MSCPRVTEISFELPAEEVAVLDGYCQSHALKRTAVFREILREWSQRKHREAILICRVAGCQPGASGDDRESPVERAQ